jgi:hypothetical protein
MYCSRRALHESIEVLTIDVAQEDGPHGGYLLRLWLRVYGGGVGILVVPSTVRRTGAVGPIKGHRR